MTGEASGGRNCRATISPDRAVSQSCHPASVTSSEVANDIGGQGRRIRENGKCIFCRLPGYPSMRILQWTEILLKRIGSISVGYGSPRLIVSANAYWRILASF